jgi:hypothetical protein
MVTASFGFMHAVGIDCWEWCCVHCCFAQDYFFHKEGTQNGGNRYATVLTYLNDVEEGGETVGGCCWRIRGKLLPDLSTHVNCHACWAVMIVSQVQHSPVWVRLWAPRLCLLPASCQCWHWHWPPASTGTS